LYEVESRRSQKTYDEETLLSNSKEAQQEKLINYLQSQVWS